MKIRRWTALLLAAAMALSLCAGTAWAEEGLTGEGSECSVCEAESVQELIGPEAEMDEREEIAPEPVPEEDIVTPEEPFSGDEETPQAAAEPCEAAPEGEPAEAAEAEAEEDNPAAAEEEEEECSYLINPAYEDLVSGEELQKELAAQEEDALEVQSGAKTYTKLADAGKALRSQMKQRKKEIVVRYKTKDKNPDKLSKKLITEAFKHTGKPTEGDYLYGQWDRMTYRLQWKKSKKQRVYTMRYRIHFFTTAAQEKKADAAVKSALAGLRLSKDSSFLKVHKIYNYVCRNVTYDMNGYYNKSTLCHSAYAAAVKKKAVCQGYATLLYRMLLQVGVPCRYVRGYSGGEGHAWNIVKLGGKYYNLDATWDASQKAAGQYFQYFLRSQANFPDHSREAEYRTAKFNKAYPMATTDGNYHVWESSYTVDVQPTCTTAGSKSIHCEDCGKRTKVTAIPALDHAWVVYGDIEYYSSYYRARFCCERCGTITGWYAYNYTQAAAGPGGAASRVLLMGPGSEASQLPERGRLCSVKSKKKGRLVVKWKKEKGADGYEVQYSRDRSFRKGVRTRKVSKGNKVTFKGLKRRKTYYVRVRVLLGGARSGWSRVKKAKVK